MAFFFVVLFVAGITDTLQHKVPNKLIASGLIASLLFAIIEHGTDGIIPLFLGLGTGFIIFFSLYLLGGVGAGDAKLMTIIGAMTSWRFVLWATYFTSIAGVFVALFYIGISKSWRESLSGAFSLKRKERIAEIANNDSRRTVPYAVAICLGSAWAFFEYFSYYGVSPLISQ